MTWKSTFVALLVVLNIHNTYGQLLPANQPEQDACGALELCGTSFHTPYSYQGNGLASDMPMTPCGSGEDNSVWLKLVVLSSGTFVFKITPVDVDDDYDFAVIDASFRDCDDLSSSDVVRCNFNNNFPVFNGGVVGLTSTASAISVESGTYGSSYCKYIDAVVGQTFLIMVNNFGAGGSLSSGFTIDFTGSTATFSSTDPPAFTEVVTPICNTNTVTIKLSSEVKCNSIAADGSDFSISPAGTPTAAWSTNCDDAESDGYTDEVTVQFASNLAPGNYTLHAQTGTDGNTLLDLCNNPLVLPDSITFSVPKLADTVRITVCENQLPYTWNGIIVSSPGPAAAIKHNTSIDGCDSTTTLSLSVVDAFSTIIDTSVCTNQVPFSWNGNIISDAGSPAATFHTTSFSGCDSNVTLNLVITPVKRTTDPLQICSNELPYNWNGTIIPAEASSTDSFTTYHTTTATGCDSFVTLDLTVFPANPVSISTDTSGCGMVIFKDSVYANTTTIIDTIRNSNGCDSLYNQVSIIVYPNEPQYKTVAANGCDSVVFEGLTYLADTALIDTFRNQHGCDSVIRTVNVYVEDFQLHLTSTPEEAAQGEYLKLNASANVPAYDILSWSPAAIFPDQNELEQNFKAYVTAVYEITGRSEIGCLDTASLRVFIDTLRPEIFLPTAFSPNGDGLNDLFGPVLYNKSGFIVKTFDIYDRWGKLVYKSDGSSQYGWNGNYYNLEKPASAGVYFYRIDVLFVNGHHAIQKGDVTLIR